MGAAHGLGARERDADHVSIDRTRRPGGATHARQTSGCGCKGLAADRELLKPEENMSSVVEKREQRIRQLLQERGIRVTDQRVKVLHELDQLRMPISHTELADRLAGAGLDRATVFRNLVSLTEAGVLVRTQLGDTVWRYELPRSEGGAHTSHPHFVCTDCGDVSCLSDKNIALKNLPAKSQVAEIQVRGRCSSCAS